ncbi:unnamed protein product [Paramecium sonneborni]|uniref:H-type lectin domain-containing protein n=1 Tax=Paramecium sonneborni TaxID=65129 RepID=A0A8S1P5Q1_9CILI|nr:unnamed protein product [Paramecium sonneborni]
MNIFAKLLGMMGICYAVIFQTGYVDNFQVWQKENVLYTGTDIGRSSTQTIYFLETFPCVPQVFITTKFIDLETGPYQEYKFEITSITQSWFSVTITSQASLKIYGIEFRYYAMCDKRFQVFTFFNMKSPFNQNPKIYHNNPNYVVGIASMTSIGYEGSFEYTFDVAQITTSFCELKLYVSSSIKQFGGQLLLGTKEAFYYLPEIPFPAEVSDFKYKDGWEGSKLFTIYTRMKYSEGDNLRVRFAKNLQINSDESNDPNDNGFIANVWYTSRLDYANFRYGAIRQNLQIGYYQPFKLTNLLITKIFDNQFSNTHSLSIKELNFETIATTLSPVIIDLNPTIDTLTITYQYLCQVGKTLKIKMLKETCNSNSLQTTTIVCSSKFKYLKIYSVFKVIKPQYSTLNIRIDTQEVNILQSYLDYQYIDQDIAIFEQF